MVAIFAADAPGRSLLETGEVKRKYVVLRAGISCNPRINAINVAFYVNKQWQLLHA
jgi:hypothetical protein